MSNGPQIFFNGILGSSAEAFSTKSLEFDGVDDYVSISNGSAVNITGNGSISFWINAATLASYTGIVSKVENTASVVSNAQYHIGMLSNGVRCVITGTDLKIGSEDVGTVPTITTGVWEHYVLTWDGSNLSLYKNGVFAASKTQVSNPSTNTEPVLIGYRNGYDYVDGKIDEVSIFNTVLSAGDVTSMYNSGQPTDLTSLSPVAWYRMGENATFKSPQILMPENTNKDKISNYSMDFDGVGDYITPSISLNTLSVTTSFSVSCWVNISTNGNYDHIIAAPPSYSAWNTGFGLYCNGSGIRFWVEQWNGANQYVETAALNTDEWYNIIATFDTINGLKLYVNGSTLTTASGTTIDGLTNTMYLGSTGTNTTYAFDGNIDEVAIWNSELSGVNAAAIYGTGKPTDLTSLSPSAWYRMGENATFKSPQILMPENTNKDKVSNYSMEFDGTSDYVNCGAFSGLNSATAMTASVWFNSSVYSSEGRLLEIGKHVRITQANATYSNTQGRFQYILRGNYGNSFKTLGGVEVLPPGTGAGNLCDGNWHHLCFVWDDATTTAIVYEDGVPVITNTSTTGTLNSATETYYIASENTTPTKPITGQINNAAVWNVALSPTEVATVYGGGTPPDLTSLNPLTWHRLGEEATFDAAATEWTIPNPIGGNNGVSANMDIYTRVGDAPDSLNNALSYNMDAAAIVEDTPPNP